MNNNRNRRHVRLICASATVGRTLRHQIMNICDASSIGKNLVFVYFWFLIFSFNVGVDFSFKETCVTFTVWMCVIVKEMEIKYSYFFIYLNDYLILNDFKKRIFIFTSIYFFIFKRVLVKE